VRNSFKALKDCVQWLGDIRRGTTWYDELEALFSEVDDEAYRLTLHQRAMMRLRACRGSMLTRMGLRVRRTKGWVFLADEAFSHM